MEFNELARKAVRTSMTKREGHALTEKIAHAFDDADDSGGLIVFALLPPDRGSTNPLRLCMLQIGNEGCPDKTLLDLPV